MIFIVAFTDGNTVSVFKFKTKEERDLFIEDLRENQYSYCTTEVL